MARSRPLIPEIAAPTGNGGAVARPRGQMSRDVYESIRAAVLDCTFLPGMALSEQSVSDELRVSRAPVREAFRQLSQEGLLEAVPQRGTFVARLSRARIEDAIFVREAIECEAAALACAASLVSRRQLSGIVRRQSNASTRGDYLTHLSEDEAFHHQILLLAGHPHAWGPLRLARTGMNRIRHLAIPAVGSNRVAIDHHRQITEAIIAGDSAAAREAMRVHIRSPLGFVDAIHKAYPHYFESA